MTKTERMSYEHRIAQLEEENAQLRAALRSALNYRKKHEKTGAMADRLHP